MSDEREELMEFVEILSDRVCELVMKDIIGADCPKEWDDPGQWCLVLLAGKEKP